MVMALTSSDTWLEGIGVMIFCIGHMEVGPDIESLHSSQLQPLFPIILVAFDVFPDEVEGETVSDCQYIIDYIISRAQGGTSNEPS